MGDNEEATAIAKRLLKKEVKIQSTAIVEMKTEMKNLLIRLERSE